MSLKYMVKAMDTRVGNSIRKLVLIKLADNANDEGYCWPCHQNVADICEIGHSTARKHISLLEEQGYLLVQNRKGPKGNTSNLYKLQFPPIPPETATDDCSDNSPPMPPVSAAPVLPDSTPMLSGSTPMPPDSTPPVPPGSTGICHSFEPVNEPVKKTLGGDSKKPDPIERDFEQLWQIKPDRGGNNPKRTALSAYRARRKEGHTHDEITAGLIRYTQQCAAYGRLGTEYVKQMATFLSKNLFFKDPWEIKPDAASRTDHKKPNAADKLRSDFERKWGDRADDIQTVS